MEFCRGMSRLIIFMIFLYNFHNIILYCNTTNNGKVFRNNYAYKNYTNISFQIQIGNMMYMGKDSIFLLLLLFLL